MLTFVELLQNVVFITDKNLFFLHTSTHTHLLVLSLLLNIITQAQNLIDPYLSPSEHS